METKANDKRGEMQRHRHGIFFLSETEIVGTTAESNEDKTRGEGIWIGKAGDLEDKVGRAMIGGERGGSGEEVIKDKGGEIFIAMKETKISDMKGMM